MKYNPQIHHRKSIRLKGYDYSQAGLYFITICTKNRECFFGNIVHDKMILNGTGKIADECWLQIPEHFPNTVLREKILMPNHVHGIIELTGNDVGTQHVVSLQNNTDTAGTSHVMSQQMSQQKEQTQQNKFSQPVAGSVSVIIQQYKSSVKRWCNKNGLEYFQWQTRFHDHIIRNEQSYQTISNYIINNPAKWNEDKFFIK